MSDPTASSSSSSGLLAPPQPQKMSPKPFDWSWIHLGELFFMAFMVVEFLAVQVSDAVDTISSTCRQSPACAAKLRPGVTFNSQVCE